MFGIVSSNVIAMMVYMLIGLLICKAGKAVVSHAKSFSGLLIYILGPAMIINAFLKMEVSVENVVKIGRFFVISFVVQLLFFGILYIFFKNKYDNPKYRILTVGSVLGNVGFIGMPLLGSIFPNEPIVLCYSSMNVISMNLIVFTLGIFLITNDRKFISLKNAILNPTTIAILIALPIYFLEIKFPPFVENMIGTLAVMVTPMCMIILGMRLSTVKLKALFSRPFVYVTCLLKLIAFPLFTFVCVRFLPVLDETFKASLVILAATPAAAIIDGLAELHECEQELAANVVLMTAILCVITLPVIVIALV